MLSAYVPHIGNSLSHYSLFKSHTYCLSWPPVTLDDVANCKGKIEGQSINIANKQDSILVHTLGAGGGGGGGGWSSLKTGFLSEKV